MSNESELFHREFAKPLQAHLVRAVIDGCQAAHVKSRAISKEFFHDAIPANRRLEVEQRLHQLLLPDTFSVTVEKTPSTHYTKIESERLVITAVTRTQEVDWVPPYRYRGTLAESAQMSWDWLGKRIPKGERLFALVIYGGAHWSKMPTMLSVVFPLPDGTFAPGSIDLLEEHASTVASYSTKPKPMEPAVALRRVKKPEEDDGDDSA
jgi:hypothetical protein